jgi:hypothetical protein
MDTLLFDKMGKVSWGESNSINSSEVHGLVCKIKEVEKYSCFKKSENFEKKTS